MKVLRSRRSLAFSIHRSSTRFVSALNGCLATPTSLNNRPVTTAGAAYHLRTTQNAQDRSQPGAKGQDRSSEVRDLPRSRERVIGIEPTTLCLASEADPYTRPSDTIPCAKDRGSRLGLTRLGWDRMAIRSGTHPVHTLRGHPRRGSDSRPIVVYGYASGRSATAGHALRDQVTKHGPPRRYSLALLFRCVSVSFFTS